MAATLRLASTALTALAVAALTGCSAPSLVVSGRAQMLRPEGRVGANVGSVAGTSTTKSLGLEEDIIVPAIGADLRFGATNLSIDAFRSSMDGTGTAEAQIDIGGITITQGTPVATEIDLDYARAALTWDLLPTDRFELGLGLGAGYADFNGRITDLSTSQTGSADRTIVFPVAAGRGVVKWKSLAAKAVASGVIVNYDGNDLTLVDLDVGGDWRFLAPSGTDHLAAHLQVGYRYLTLDAEFDDGSSRARADLDFLGPYLGLAVSF